MPMSSSTPSSGGGTGATPWSPLCRLAARVVAKKASLVRPEEGSSQESRRDSFWASLSAATPWTDSSGPSPPATQPGWNHRWARWSSALRTRKSPTSMGPLQALEQQDCLALKRLTETAQEATPVCPGAAGADTGASTAAGAGAGTAMAATPAPAAAPTAPVAPAAVAAGTAAVATGAGAGASAGAVASAMAAPTAKASAPPGPAPVEPAWASGPCQYCPVTSSPPLAKPCKGNAGLHQAAPNARQAPHPASCSPALATARLMI